MTLDFSDCTGTSVCDYEFLFLQVANYTSQCLSLICSLNCYFLCPIGPVSLKAVWVSRKWLTVMQIFLTHYVEDGFYFVIAFGYCLKIYVCVCACVFVHLWGARSAQTYKIHPTNQNLDLSNTYFLWSQTTTTLRVCLSSYHNYRTV